MFLKWQKKKTSRLFLSTLVSNLKDQPPFISIKSDNFPPADKIYNQAEQELSYGNNKVCRFSIQVCKGFGWTKIQSS